MTNQNQNQPDETQCRTKIVFITPEILRTILTKEVLVSTGIPLGSTILNLGYDPTSNRLYLIINHPSFPILPPNSRIPELEILYYQQKLFPMGPNNMGPDISER
jgi:hypothetical protein